jgi:hypothetical protein
MRLRHFDWLIPCGCLAAVGAAACALLSEPAYEAPPTAGQPVVVDGSGGTVTYTPPAGTTEPVTTELPGGATVTVAPGAADPTHIPTKGEVLVQGAAGAAGSLLGLPPGLSMLGAQVIAGLIGALANKKKKAETPQ